MKLPAYWSRATVEEPDSRGGTMRFSCWRWSDVSLEDAQRSALESARRIVRKFLADEPLDRYGYGSAALREDVKQRFLDETGTLAAAITQNAYGSLVLNTARVMFVDIDLPAATVAASIGYFFRKWFKTDARSPTALVEEQASKRIEDFFAENSQWSGRLYRTHSGFRLLVTHALFDPEEDEVQRAFKFLQSDPLYVRLCREQKCFRARLTPKPWRCGHTPNVVSWPRESDDQQRKFAIWHEKYLNKQSAYSTCRFVVALGNGGTNADAQLIIELHDRLTRCDENLPLA